jgi:hypothetical protein
MKTRALSSALLLGAGLILALGWAWHAGAAAGNSANIVGGGIGNPGAVGASANTNSGATAASQQQPAQPLRLSWPHEPWANLPPLPDVTYAVVPLRALGWPTDAVPTEIDDYAGVLGDWGWSVDWAHATIYWWPEYGFDDPYIVPVLSYGWGEIWDYKDAFLYWRPEVYDYIFNPDLYFYAYALNGLAWPWDNYPWPGWGDSYALNPRLWGNSPQTRTRRMSNDGLVAGWVVDWDENGWALGIRPAVSSPWQEDWWTLPASPNDYPFVTSSALGVNTWGDVAMWGTASAWWNFSGFDQAVVSAGGIIPAGASVPDWLNGSLKYATYGDHAYVPHGEAFVPQFVNNFGHTAGLLYSISTTAAAGAENFYPLYGAGRVTGEPVVYLPDGQVRELQLDATDWHELWGLTSGWQDGNGTLLVPPVTWGLSWHRTSPSGGDWRWWWSHPEGGPDGTWQTKTIAVYDPEDENQDYPLDPADLRGMRQMNGRLEMIANQWDWWDGAHTVWFPTPGLVWNARFYTNVP